MGNFQFPGTMGKFGESPSSPTLIITTKMAKKIEKLGSAKRFGARYGTKPKYQFAKIEKEQRRKHKCPYCNAIAVKRIAMGIWNCRKCDSTFTGRAYTITKPVAVEEKIEEPKQIIEEEADEAVEEVTYKEGA